MLVDCGLVDGEIKGEVKGAESGFLVEFKTTKEFFHEGESNLKIWFTKSRKRKSFYTRTIHYYRFFRFTFRFTAFRYMLLWSFGS